MKAVSQNGHLVKTDCVYKWMDAYKGHWLLRVLLNLYKVKMIFVTELTFGYLSLKNPILRDKCSVKGKITLVRKLAILGRRWTHVPKNQFLTANEGARGVWGRGRCAEQLRKLVTQWFDQHHLNCFKYNLQFWGQFVPISLRPVHGIVQDGAAYVMAPV